MATNERNRLRGGVESLLRRSVGPDEPNEVKLVNKSGRPPKDSPTGWNSKRDYRTSIVMDREQHNELKRLANSKGMTFKEVMYLLIEEGLRRLDAGELEMKGNL